jgi:hypothetical protein
MIRYGRKLKMTRSERELLATDGPPPRIETVDDYLRALKDQYEYFSGDTPNQRVFRYILEAGIRDAEQMTEESAGKVG